MPRIVKALTDFELKKLTKKVGRYAVGGAGATGLAVKVKQGAVGLLKNWELRRRTKILGEITRCYGRYPEVSLEAARAFARADNDLIAQGINPHEADAQAAREEAEAKAKAVAGAVTVGDVLHEWIEWRALNKGWKKPEATIAKEERRIRANVPKLLSVPVATCEPEDVAAALEDIWTTKSRTADRVGWHISSLFEWAMTVKKCRPRGINPAEGKWLKPLLAGESRRKQETHFAALDIDQIPPFVSALVRDGNLAAQCLLVAILTCTRSANVRAMRWDQLNEDRTVWEIDAEEMKVTENGQHIIPLSPEVRRIIRELEDQRLDSRFVFPSRNGKPLSENAMNQLIERMDVQEIKAGREGWIDRRQTKKYGKRRRVVQHAVSRATFETWAHANREDERAVQLILHHEIDPRLKGAYDRYGDLPYKREVLDHWAVYCFSQVDEKSEDDAE